jgi:hypothetical protein
MMTDAQFKLAELAQDRLALALTEAVLEEDREAEGDAECRRYLLHDLNALLCACGVMPANMVLSSHLDKPLVLEGHLRECLAFPAQVLAKELPNRLQKWLRKPVPPKGDRGAWAAEGRFLVEQARTSDSDFDCAGFSGKGAETARQSFLHRFRAWLASKFRPAPPAATAPHPRGARLALALALATTAAVGLFPPWTSTEHEFGSHYRQKDAGFAFLFNPPTSIEDTVQVDIPRLLIECVCIWSLAGAVLLLLPKARPHTGETPAETSAFHDDEFGEGGDSEGGQYFRIGFLALKKALLNVAVTLCWILCASSGFAALCGLAEPSFVLAWACGLSGVLVSLLLIRLCYRAGSWKLRNPFS